MEQQQLPLNEELTDFADGPPPSEGWWNCRIMAEDNEPLGTDKGGRRFWDGTEWSWPVYLGESDADMEQLKKMKTRKRIQWQGLLHPRQQ